MPLYHPTRRLINAVTGPVDCAWDLRARPARTTASVMERHSVRKDVQDDNRQYDSGNQCCRGNYKGNEMRADDGQRARCELKSNVAVPVAY
jgi:hypothetical protein